MFINVIKKNIRFYIRDGTGFIRSIAINTEIIIDNPRCDVKDTYSLRNTEMFHIKHEKTEHK